MQRLMDIVKLVFPTTPWTSLEPSDKNGIVKIRITDYQGGVE